jgi:serine protease Do
MNTPRRLSLIVLLLAAAWLPPESIRAQRAKREESRTAAAQAAQKSPAPQRSPAPQSQKSPATKPRTQRATPNDVRAPARKAANARDPSLIFAGGAPKTVEDLKAMQAVVQRVSEKVMDSTVGVRVGPAQGSGVIVTKEGHVLTAAHVAGSPGREVSFLLHDGRTVTGKTLGLYYDLDAGLMQITEPGPWPAVPVADSGKVKVGQWCLGTGHPGGYQRDRNAVLRFGRVLKIEDDGLTTDVTLVGGDSGGPLFNMEGHVIGVHSRIGNALTTNVHVPSSIYRQYWDRLVKSEAWGSQPDVGPFIGVVGANDAKDARIAHVNPGGPAERAGIRAGDVITRFDGKELTDFESLSRAVRSKDPGDRVRVEVLRDGQTLGLSLTVGSRDE